jgi:sigma-B regulation protein RsbU (phosphoserine phosphatase)
MSGPTILVVDDTPTNIDMVESVLSAEGFHTISAQDGETAVTMTRAESPDLILLDVVMPGESGFETCARLKSDAGTADIPIIFLSSLDDVKSKVTGLKVGGVDFISKPFYAEEVLARVRVHLRIRETNKLLLQQTRARLEQLREAQRAILVRPDDLPEASFSVYFEPLEEAGGDVYDVLPIDSEVFSYFVADVSGHGVSAAYPTSAIKALLRQYTSPLFSPEDTLRNVDSVMRQIFGEEQFMTVCYARLNRRFGRLTVVSAGNPPLILVNQSGQVRIVDIDSEPLGLFNSSVLQRKDVKVSRGDRFYLYSDGLIEACPGGGRDEGLRLLTDACVRHRSAPLCEVPANIVADLRPSKEAIQDDLLLMAVEVP